MSLPTLVTEGRLKLRGRKEGVHLQRQDAEEAISFLCPGSWVELNLLIPLESEGIGSHLKESIHTKVSGLSQQEELWNWWWDFQEKQRKETHECLVDEEVKAEWMTEQECVDICLRW
jgi:hypothetical protein